MKEFSWDKMKTLRDYQWNGSVFERSWNEEMNSHHHTTSTIRFKEMNKNNKFSNKLSELNYYEFNNDNKWWLKIFIS